MREYGCSAQEFNHVETINQIDIRSLGYRPELSMFVIRLDRVADVSSSHAEEARTIAARISSASERR
jgi:hypothetical protein